METILAEDKVVEEKVHDDVEAPIGDLNELAELVNVVNVKVGVEGVVVNGVIVESFVVGSMKCKNCAFKEHVEYPNECLDEEKVKGGTIAW